MPHLETFQSAIQRKMKALNHARKGLG